MAAPFDPIAAVSQRVESFSEAQVAVAGEWGPQAQDLVRSAAASLRGGKRLRAQFCLTGWASVTEANGSRNYPDDHAVGVAAALEIFHAAALVHDDLIDNSDTRRGRPAAHREWESFHQRSQWVGDAAAFGRATAVLLGDLLLAWSDDLFEESIRDRPHANATRAAYALMRREVTVGQFLDVAEESAHVSVPDEEHAERALRVAALKSARYSVLQPLVIGATLAGGSREQREALERFGLPLGIAYQLRDDVLGVFGDSSVTGKPAGDDLREGKRTLLIAYARAGVPAGARRAIDELLGDPDLSDAQIASLQRTLIDSGSLSRVEQLITDSASEADRALRGAPLGTHAVGRLRDLARAATDRQS